MNTIKMTILAVVAALAFAACSAEGNYNDTVVNLYEKYSSEMERVIDETNSDADASAKLAAIERLSALTDSCTTVMSGLKPNEDAKDFHQAVTGLYDVIRSEFIPVYRSLLALEDTEENIEEYNRLVDEANAVAEKLDAQEDKAISAQHEFAQKMNMQLR